MYNEENYKWDEETMSFTKIVVPTIEKRVPGWKFTYQQVIIFIVALFLGIGTGILVSEATTVTVREVENINVCKQDVIGSNEWRDSVFTDYTNKANKYLSGKNFEGTPIKGEMLALAAENAYDSTGILLPVELCLAQCQWESGMGLKGRSPKNNPFNVGENDSGTVKWFDNTFDGTQSYFYLMCNDYLRCRGIDELFVNFVNCDGHRYASGDYENHVPNQYYFIVNWLDKN